ncbi:uncharacterized protein BX663DRAFT_474221 [Cokeromyces recurvatus]|uniref:uncharacterized protein n=1 Tax=Cokeromyces recurvatus TaxID=90255 RepID=UPI00221F49E1|nr:uncharacterized protein BX663DRAFT_474221 [Cokeromyces recurvatus]KAI7902259.1 hypothetical protein BX663DRAFT_474221 [Cokeromyces recurvatus]
MKIKPSIITLICICLWLFISPSFAIVRTEELAEWTKDGLASYFKKYKIIYDKTQDHPSLVKIAESYKDAASTNMKYFGDSVDRILSGFTDSLQKNTRLASNDLSGFITNLKHQLRQLELKGELTQDHVRAILDKAHHQAIRQRIMTEAEWKKAYAVFQSYYQQPKWYQRVLGFKSQVDAGASSLNQWIQSVIDHIVATGSMTKEEAKTLTDEIRTSVTKTDLHNLGDKAWVEELTQSITDHTKLEKDKVESIIESIKHDIEGYKIFGLEYTGQAKEEAKHWYGRTIAYCQDVWYQIQAYIRQIQVRVRRFWYSREVQKTKKAAENAAERASDSLMSVASSITSEWQDPGNSRARSRTIHSVLSKASSAAVQATNMIYDMDLKNIDLKGTFAHYWTQKEHDAYRRLGYTEAHIDWIKNYLYKTFRNQKTLARFKADEAGIAIRRYLEDLGIQSPAQVEDSVHMLKRHLELWRTLID